MRAFLGRYLAERKSTLQVRASTFLGGIIGTVWKSFEIPTDKLAKVFVDFAIGDGEPVPVGQDVGAEERVLSNVALRRLAPL